MTPPLPPQNFSKNSSVLERGSFPQGMSKTWTTIRLACLASIAPPTVIVKVKVIFISFRRSRGMNTKMCFSLFGKKKKGSGRISLFLAKVEKRDRRISLFLASIEKRISQIQLFSNFFQFFPTPFQQFQFFSSFSKFFQLFLNLFFNYLLAFFNIFSIFFNVFFNVFFNFFSIFF